MRMNINSILKSVSIILTASPLHAAVMLTDDFGSYGSTLTTGATTDPATYSWNIVNHVNNSLGIPITATGVELAGRYAGHSHPRNWTAEADIVFTPEARPTVNNASLTFNLVERHEHTELDIVAVGRPNAEKFIFSGTGLIRMEFTDVGIDEYLNERFLRSRTYASVGWEPTDQISMVKFIGLHHDNGSINRSYIDNISFVAVPEPGTTLLAAIGLTALLRRRVRSQTIQ